MNCSLYKIPVLLTFLFISSIAVAAQTSFDACLDNSINPGDLVVSGGKRITVKEKLTALKARCRRGKLVDAKRREIKFFKRECWGNPPADYLEIQQQQRAELARLKKKYTVVEIACVTSVALPH
jgi:hypothetical protein